METELDIVDLLKHCMKYTVSVLYFFNLQNNISNQIDNHVGYLGNSLSKWRNLIHDFDKNGYVIISDILQIYKENNPFIHEFELLIKLNIIYFFQDIGCEVKNIEYFDEDDKEDLINDLSKELNKEFNKNFEEFTINIINKLKENTFEELDDGELAIKYNNIIEQDIQLLNSSQFREIKTHLHEYRKNKMSEYKEKIRLYNSTHPRERYVKEIIEKNIDENDTCLYCQGDSRNLLNHIYHHFENECLYIKHNVPQEELKILYIDYNQQ
jgi:hypothetical protein